MKNPSNNVLRSTCLAMALLSAGSIAMAESPQDVLQARQEAQIWTTYALSPYLRANRIEVSVENGKATLKGTVQEDVSRDLARQIALGVEGIEQVDNQILVQADYMPPVSEKGERSYGELIDDAGITMAVKSKLLWSKHTSGLKIDVDTMEGVVSLQGTADSDVSRELAGTMAVNTRGVKSVENQLTVSKPVTGKAETAGQQISDSWITTKVKSTLIYSSNVKSADIAVNTADGVVTLSGNLGSGAEKALAIELAQNIRGVREVKAKELTF